MYKYILEYKKVSYFGHQEEFLKIEKDKEEDKKLLEKYRFGNYLEIDDNLFYFKSFTVIHFDDLTKLKALKIYKREYNPYLHQNQVWCELTNFFDKKIFDFKKDLLEKRKLIKRPPSKIMESQNNLTNAPQIPDYRCRKCWGTTKVIKQYSNCINIARCHEINDEICDELCGIEIICPVCNGTGKTIDPEYDIYGNKLMPVPNNSRDVLIQLMGKITGATTWHIGIWTGTEWRLNDNCPKWNNYAHFVKWIELPTN